MIFRRFLTVILMALPSMAPAIDLQPNDIVAPLPGRNHAMISYLNIENGTFYRNGTAVSTRQFANPNISTQSAIARVSTSYSLSDLPAISYLQLP